MEANKISTPNSKPYIQSGYTQTQIEALMDENAPEPVELINTIENPALEMPAVTLITEDSGHIIVSRSLVQNASTTLRNILVGKGV